MHKELHTLKKHRRRNFKTCRSICIRNNGDSSNSRKSPSTSPSPSTGNDVDESTENNASNDRKGDTTGENAVYDGGKGNSSEAKSSNVTADENLDGDGNVPFANDTERDKRQTNTRCTSEECRKAKAEERHKQKIARLKREEQDRKRLDLNDIKQMQNGSSFMSLLDISNVARMPASGLASYSQEEGKEIRENQDSANVTKKIEDFQKASSDCDDKKAALDKANAKLAITKEQAGRMKKKTAIAAKATVDGQT